MQHREMKKILGKFEKSFLLTFLLKKVREKIRFHSLLFLDKK
jgi:hypothetical protein